MTPQDSDLFAFAGRQDRQIVSKCGKVCGQAYWRKSKAIEVSNAERVAVRVEGCGGCSRIWWRLSGYRLGWQERVECR